MRKDRALLASWRLPCCAGHRRAGLRRSHDPDWPCIQRKVPRAVARPDLERAGAAGRRRADWSKDHAVSSLVEEMAARRVPIADAQQEIRISRPCAAGRRTAEPTMAMLVTGLFDHMNAERSQVISGIARYAHKQLEMAAGCARRRPRSTRCAPSRTRTPPRSPCEPTG